MVKKATAWAIRIDDLPGVADKIVDWCSAKGVVLCTKEYSDDDSVNPHYHIAMRTAEVSQETIRNWVKALLPPTATRSDYATGEWKDDDRYLRYCCKGPNWHNITKGVDKEPLKPIVIYRMLMSPTVESLHADFWKENVASKPKGKIERNELVQMCVEHVKASGIGDDYLSRMEIASAYVVRHFKGKVNDHVIFPVVQSVLWHLDRNRVEADVFSRMRKKFCV